MRLLLQFLIRLMHSLYQKLGIFSAFAKRRSRNRLILRLLLTVSIVFFLAVTFDYIRIMTILFIFVLLNASFAYMKKFLPFAFRRYSYGFELVLLCTVVSSFALGSNVGLIMGILLMVVNYLAESRPSDYFVVSVTLYAIIGYNVFFFKELGIIKLGILSAIIYNAFAFIFSKLLGGKVSALIFFNITNLFSNIILFSIYGEFFLSLLI